MTMRALFVLLLLTGVAHAEGRRFSLIGLGTSVVEQAPGWAFRIESGFDVDDADEDEGGGIMGGSTGIDVWSANERWGFSLPIGYHVGGQMKGVRSRIGGGFGLLALEGGSTFTGGISPFANASIEKTTDELIIALEGRITRQVIAEQPDHNVYSVMLMAGRRFDRN
jgi:hypothetical protein